MSSGPPRILLEGRPGAGKTTAVARLAELLRGVGATVTGILTHEVREGSARVGFALETLDGRRGTLARAGARGTLRVGRYGVVLDDLERLAIPALAADADVVVVDELGRMELASVPFRAAVLALLERPVAVVATVHTRADPFTDALKRRPAVGVVRVTPSNRARLPAELADMLLRGRETRA
jgi:nucleoside-triphosphatase